MKKISGWGIFGISLAGILLICVMWGIGTYNGIVGLKEDVDNQSSNISTQLQRRSDLIPNLVSTVKGYTSHESEVLNEISESRAKLAGAQSMSEKAEANSQLSSAVSRLLVVVENYPNLKADTQFTSLTDELSGTENRIAVARKDYNASVKKYNQKIKVFPANIISGICGFTSADYFEASQGSTQVPSVSFS